MRSGVRTDTLDLNPVLNVMVVRLADIISLLMHGECPIL
jgi:hypothetical protein